MKQWMVGIVSFMMLSISVINLAPSKKYEGYIRFIMGVIMLLVMITPIYNIAKGDFSNTIKYYSYRVDSYLDSFDIKENGGIWDNSSAMLGLKTACEEEIEERFNVKCSINLISDEDGRIIRVEGIINDDTHVMIKENTKDDNQVYDKENAKDNYLDDDRWRSIKKFISEFYNLDESCIHVCIRGE